MNKNKKHPVHNSMIGDTKAPLPPDVREFFVNEGRRGQELEQKRNPEAYRKERARRGRAGGRARKGRTLTNDHKEKIKASKIKFHKRHR